MNDLGDNNNDNTTNNVSNQSIEYQRGYRDALESIDKMLETFIDREDIRALPVELVLKVMRAAVISDKEDIL